MVLLLNSVCRQSIRRPCIYYLTRRCHPGIIEKTSIFPRSVLSSGYRCTSNVPPDLTRSTPTHMARMVAQAVRFEVEDNNAKGAVSLAYSVFEWPMDPGIKPFKPISKKAVDFGRPMPSRLVAHALVHALLHKGLLLDAASELRCMVSLGHRFHAKTLQATFGLLCSSNLPTEPSVIDIENASVPPDDTETARLLASQSHNSSPEIREALNLLLTLRLSYHRRGKGMFDQLIDACLLQGQIVIATLLFVLMVKDWQLRSAVQGSSSEIKAAETDNFVKERVVAHLVNLGSPSLEVAKHLACINVMPNTFSLAKILRIINQNILLSSSPEIVKLECIESLLILSELLRDGSLPGSQVSYLIRILQNCPSSPSFVTGVVRNGQYVEVNAYESIHSTLKHLCSHAPTTRPRATLADPRVSSPMEFAAYTALLHYALRHHFSPDLANDVLNHMTKHRQPPLNPDISVYNILLRSSSLLRRNDLAEQILNQFDQRSGNTPLTINGKELEIIRGSTSRRDIWHVPRKTGMALTIRRIRSKHLDLSNLAQSENIVPDMYTLTSYIMHLVSTGQPEAVVDIVFQLFPELDLQRMQEENGSGRRLSKEEIDEIYRRCIIRGVQFGPRIFCVLLNALAKAGKTGLSERVYRLAKDAELTSWNPNKELEQSTPWRLPIHAYTSLLQCYGNESRRALECIRGSNQGLQHPPFRRKHSTTPSLGRIFVHGWGRDIRTYAEENDHYLGQPLLRSTIARKESLDLHKSLQRDTYTVWKDVMHARRLSLNEYPPQWAVQLRQQIPVPDESFFNALLEIFGRRTGMQVRRFRESPSWWRRRLNITRQSFARRGVLCMTYDPTLVEIAKCMAEFGYELPPAFQRALVGRVSLTTEQVIPHRVGVVPYAFPHDRVPKFKAFSLHVINERGLPLRRPSRIPRYRRSWQATKEKGTGKTI